MTEVRACPACGLDSFEETADAAGEAVRGACWLCGYGYDTAQEKASPPGPVFGAWGWYDQFGAHTWGRFRSEEERATFKAQPAPAAVAAWASEPPGTEGWPWWHRFWVRGDETDVRVAFGRGRRARMSAADLKAESDEDLLPF